MVWLMIRSWLAHVEPQNLIYQRELRMYWDISATARVKAKVISGHCNFHFNFALFVLIVYYLISYVFFVFFFIHVITNSTGMRFFLDKLFVEDYILILELVGMLLKCKLATHWSIQTQQCLTATPVKIMSWQQHVGSMNQTFCSANYPTY